MFPRAWSPPSDAEGLEREITELACHIHAATCRWLELVAEYDLHLGVQALIAFAPIATMPPGV